MTEPIGLGALGWDHDIEKRTAPLCTAGLQPGRVVRVDRGEVDVAIGDVHSDIRATTTTAARDCVAGDWVAFNLERQRVEAVAARRTAFVRRASRGARTPQTLAANMDVVLVVAGLEPGLNVRRLERELVMAHDSRATPIVVLTKTDVVDSATAKNAVNTAMEVAPGVEVFAVSNRSGDGFDALRSRVAPGLTFALLGASGVGKSTLVNTLAGSEIQLTAEIRASDGKGRHTTTSARLLRLASGQLLLDTPGVRALALWESWDGLALTFSDIEELATSCQFADCFHDDEPGCAVLAAENDHRLDPARLENWRRMRDEMATLDADLTEAQRRRDRTGRPERETEHS